jgi:hypothetical protein
LCNPVKVFNCIVSNANSEPKIIIDHYVEPTFDRSKIESESMPSILIYPDEIKTLVDIVPEDIISAQLANGYNYSDVQKIVKAPKLNQKALSEAIPYINEVTRNALKLRDTDVASENSAIYARRR